MYFKFRGGISLFGKCIVCVLMTLGLPLDRCMFFFCFLGLLLWCDDSFGKGTVFIGHRHDRTAAGFLICFFLCLSDETYCDNAYN